jgi:molybdopterin/thiamine biosynthesis adenylyltransferase
VKRAVILGAGGLGCPAALALAESAGSRIELRLVDHDVVERSNLPRQILFRDADQGRPKAAVAASRLQHLARVEPVVARFDAASAASLLDGADVLLDGTDNFETRFAANDAALAAGIPLVHGAALGWQGQLLTVLPGQTACLRCLFEAPPPPGSLPTCAEAGVAAPLCGLVGAAMADEAIAILEGGGPAAAGRLISWHGLTGVERTVEVPIDLTCRCSRLQRPASKTKAEDREAKAESP